MMIGGVPIPLQAQIIGSSPREILDPLPYTPSDNGSNAYFYGSINSINDGDLGNYYYGLYGGGPGGDARPNSGLTVQSTAFTLFVTFAQSVYINQLVFNFGQFNGFGNIPSSFSVYRGTTTANLLYSTSAIDRGTVADQSFDVSSNSAFATAASIYRFDFVAPVWVSILELRIYGTA